MLEVKELILVKEQQKEGTLKAKLFSDGVIEFSFDDSIQTVEIEHLKLMQQFACELGNGKKMPLLFYMHDFLVTAPDAQKYATSEEGTKYTSKVVVIVDSFAKRLIMNFFMRINKPIVPTKAISEINEAHQWLTEDFDY